MKLTFTNDISSIDLLDGIMNSYPGRDQGTIMAERQSVTTMIALLLHQKIVVTEFSYPYDHSIRDDDEMMALYSELARQTRWKRLTRTQIEGVRINALRQMKQAGRPFYDGEFICYQEGRICVHCGNLELSKLLMYLADHEQVSQLYIFTCPCQTDDRMSKYYCFDLSETAIQGAKIYREYVWDKLLEASKVDNIVPAIPESK